MIKSYRQCTGRGSKKTCSNRTVIQRQILRDSNITNEECFRDLGMFTLGVKNVVHAIGRLSFGASMAVILTKLWFKSFAKTLEKQNKVGRKKILLVDKKIE